MIDLEGVAVDPASDDALEFVDATSGGAVPASYVAAVARGARDAMTAGPLAGYPLVGLKLTLTDGAVHAKDSSELAFRAAGALALREAATRAHPVLIEPVMHLEVMVPQDHVGTVMGDLSSRRGQVEALDDGPSGSKVVRARAPLAELFGYAGALRNMTQGRGSFTMTIGSYEVVPPRLAQAIIG